MSAPILICCVWGNPEKGDALDPTGESELRPYGPGDQPICFSCATATPERDQATTERFNVLLDRIQAAGGVPVITEAGVFPLKATD